MVIISLRRLGRLRLYSLENPIIQPPGRTRIWGPFGAARENPVIFPYHASVLRLAALMVLLGSCLGCRAVPERPKVREGLLDLRAYDLEGRGPVPLSGTWAFYWQRLLGPEAFKGEAAGPPDEIGRASCRERV